MLLVPDDSGFLALVVPASYRSFVSEDWSFELLLDHFRQQMADRSLLIWGTGLEGFWRVDLRVGESDIRGFREVTGPIRVVGRSLLVTSYDSLTMAAQFSDAVLPQPHEQDLRVELPDGNYCCRVVQMFDPHVDDHAEGQTADFVLMLSELPEPLPAWSEIPWYTDA
jgi:hypothetical protein